MIISMLCYCIYLVLEFNFEIDNQSVWMTYFNLIIRKYLNSISMVFVAYYFFSKSVKGYKDKVIWKIIMKGLLYIAFIVDVVILLYFWTTYYSSRSVESFHEYIVHYGVKEAMKYCVCNDPTWLIFEIYYMFFFAIFILFIYRLR